MRRTASRIAAYAGAIVLALWVAVPIYLIALAAFSSGDSVYAYPKELLPRHVSTDTLRFFLQAQGIVAALERSIIVAALTIVATLVIGAPAGYALARLPFRGSTAFRLTIVSTRAFPIVILAIPLSVIFLRWGIDDTVLGVVIAHTALALPFVVLLTASVFTGVSEELEEAAMTLGCSRASAFRKVVLPLALPGLAAASIFTFVISWNDVFAATALTLEHRTLPAEVLVALTRSPLPFQFAGGFLLLAPSLVVIFVIRKYLFNMWGNVLR